MHQEFIVHCTVEELADHLGSLKAKIAELSKVEDDIKAELLDRGVISAEGTSYILTVSQQSRKVFDQAAAKEALGPQFVEANTKTTTYPVIKVSARK